METHKMSERIDVFPLPDAPMRRTCKLLSHRAAWRTERKFTFFFISAASACGCVTGKVVCSLATMFRKYRRVPRGLSPRRFVWKRMETEWSRFSSAVVEGDSQEERFEMVVKKRKTY